MSESCDKNNTEFLEFMYEYQSLIRRHTAKKNELRLHSHSYYLLSMLNANDGTPMIMTECAERLSITKQQLSKTVATLERNEYVKRTPSEENKRIMYLSITETGKYFLLHNLDKEVKLKIGGILEKFDENEQRDIMRCVNKIAEYFSEEAKR